MSIQNGIYFKGLYQETNVLLGDGTIKTIKNVRVGDILVGDDSTVRNVLAIKSGIDHMYRIIPSKGEPFICSGKFMLTLKGLMPRISLSKTRSGFRKPTVHYSQQGHVKNKSFETENEATNFCNSLPKEDIFDISIIDYNVRITTFKHCTYLFHQGINFRDSDVPFDPYIIGYWLGDGTTRDATFTTADLEIVDYFNKKLPEYGLELTKLQDKYGYNICISGINYRAKGKNSMLNTLKRLKYD